VMTYRPGRIRRIVEIDLPRPRSSEIVGSEAFGRYVGTIWADLREEANRGIIFESVNLLRSNEYLRRTVSKYHLHCSCPDTRASSNVGGCEMRNRWGLGTNVKGRCYHRVYNVCLCRFTR